MQKKNLFYITIGLDAKVNVANGGHTKALCRKNTIFFEKFLFAKISAAMPYFINLNRKALVQN